MSGKYLKNGKGMPAPEKKPRKTWKMILLSVLLVILALAVAVTGFLWSKLDLIQYDDEVDYNVYESLPTVPPTEDEVEETLDISHLELVETAPVIPDSMIFEDSDVLNILVIGTDERTEEFNYSARSDCMILVSIHRKDNTVKLVSLERGIAAPVLEGIHAGEHDWLTHIFRYGGAELLRKTVEHCFKVDVDHYVRFNFTSVKRIIDAIGGVEIELTEQEANYLNTERFYMTGTTNRLKAGLNHMDGYDTLGFCRLRRIDSDWKRVERQRKTILAVVDAVKDSNLLELNELANVVLPMVQTNLTKLEIAELVMYAPNFLTSTFDQMTIPKEGTYGGMNCMQGRGGFAVDYEINNDLLYRFLYEGATSEELLAE